MAHQKSVLVADLGGTNARFACAQWEAAQVRLTNRAVLPAKDYPTLEQALAHYLAEVRAPPTNACFAVAGPLGEGVFQFTNLDWRFDPLALKKTFDWGAFHLVNDFAAMARGAADAQEATLTPIAEGRPDPTAPKIVMGPGTGLGLAVLVPEGEGWRVLPAEGGHVAFAPQTAREHEVWAALAAIDPYVSVERVASGSGLPHVYRALGGQGELNAKQIAARADQDPAAAGALDTFFSALGVFAGNAVLTTGARGGVLLCGGMLPALEARLHGSDFVPRFRNRGVMSAYLADVPVMLNTDENAALVGAALLFAERNS
jgi:glucokinase